MHDNLEKCGRRLSIDGDPRRHRGGYLSEGALREYRRLFDKAERRARNHRDFLYRVKVARLPIIFAQLQLGYRTVDKRRAMADESLRMAEQEKIWMLTEVDWRGDQVDNTSRPAFTVDNREMYRAHLKTTLKDRQGR